MSTLERAIQIAAGAHAGQVDRGGQPYILHPLWVAARLGGEDRIIGVLHDVLEDTLVTAADLRAFGFQPSIIEDLEALTRRDGETYEAFIDRVDLSPRARRVKLADLDHNRKIGRIADPGPEDLARIKKYDRAYARLVRGAWS